MERNLHVLTGEEGMARLTMYRALHAHHGGATGVGHVSGELGFK